MNESDCLSGHGVVRHAVRTESTGSVEWTLQRVDFLLNICKLVSITIWTKIGSAR